jgi:hypothetical protein
MVSNTLALVEQDVDKDFELANKMREVSAILIDSIEKLRFVART